MSYDCELGVRKRWVVGGEAAARERWEGGCSE